jgi:hypothetical protein
MFPPKGKKHVDKCGQGLEDVNISADLLIRAGYRHVFNHVLSRVVFDDQWISNISSFGEAMFPRFHIVRKAGRWYIHYDYFEAGAQDGHKTKTRCKEITKEIKRLKTTYSPNA